VSIEGVGGFTIESREGEVGRREVGRRSAINILVVGGFTIEVCAINIL